jgi:hypothetical protein
MMHITYETKITSETKLSEISSDVPEAAQDITVGDLIALHWGKPSAEILELKVKDIGTIHKAIGNIMTADVSKNLSVGDSCCCCCCPCCSCCV